MNNDDALYLLGIEGTTDTSAVRQAYERRRLEFEQRLSNTSSEGLKNKYHSTLSDLDQAYQLLVGRSGAVPIDQDLTARREQKSIQRSANSASLAGNASTGGTLLRSAGDAALTSNGLEIGHVLANRYEIRRVLGQGGMGAVYEGFDQLKEESVAIKVLLPQYLGNQQGRERFMHEAKMACRLAHPNIVKVFDVGLAEPYHFITMELLEGQTLREQMEARKADRETYSVTQVLDYAQQLVGALEYAHKQIVHRDLKPENVWVCTDGTLKLIDFGIARAFTKSALTRTGMVMGTAYYMAPEQFNGAKDVDWRADQYSLAVILYELLTGRIPQGTFAATSELRKDVPLGLSRALMKALAPDPAARFDSLANFAAGLSSRDAVPIFSREKLVWAAISATIVLAIGGLWASGVFRHTTQDIAATASGSMESPTTTAAALEGKTLSLFKHLQDKEKELATEIAQQQTRYDHASADVQNARTTDARAAAESQLAKEGRELQIRHELQQETQRSVFSDAQWSAHTGQIRSGQSLLHDGKLAAATTQLTTARDALANSIKLVGDIENFVRARAKYLDAKRPWLDFSIQHAGRQPTNPAIKIAEEDIPAAIERGEYARLATDVFPKLASLYRLELQPAQRLEGTRTASPNRANNATPATGTAQSAYQTAAPTKQEIKAERKQEALLEKCAKARHRPRNCPDTGTDSN